MKLITWITLIILTLSLIYGGLYVYSLSQITIPDVQLNKLEDVNLKGFKISGDILVQNNGLIPIKIGKIKYYITLDFNNEILSEGELSGTWIYPFQQRKYFFSNKIFWVPSVSLALDMLKPGSTTASIDGFVYLVDLKYIDLKVPFHQSIDLEDYIGQFTTDFLETTINQVKDTVKSVGDFAKDTWEGIKNIFS